MFDALLFDTKINVFEFNYQKLNTIKSVQCSKNDVWGRLMFDISKLIDILNFHLNHPKYITVATLQSNCRTAVLVGWPQNVAKTNFTFISSQKAVLLLNFGQNNHFLCDEVTSKVTYTFYNVYFQIEVSLFGCLHFEVN